MKADPCGWNKFFCGAVARNSITLPHMKWFAVKQVLSDDTIATAVHTAATKGRHHQTWDLMNSFPAASLSAAPAIDVFMAVWRLDNRFLLRQAYQQGAFKRVHLDDYKMHLQDWHTQMGDDVVAWVAATLEEERNKMRHLY